MFSSRTKLSLSLLGIACGATGLGTAALTVTGAGPDSARVSWIVVSLACSAGAAFLTERMASRSLRTRLARLAADLRTPPDHAAASRPDEDEHGQIGAIARELTTIVQALRDEQRAFREERARLEAILTDVNDGVLVIGADGRVELANAAIRRCLLIEHDPAGRHYIECVRSPTIVAHIEAARQHATAGSEPAILEQDERVFLARAVPSRVPSRSGVVLSLHEITDLVRADRMRRDFVANVSHELRTPLTAIRGYIEALRDGDADVAARDHFYEVISRNAVRMDFLVKDLLRLAQLEGSHDPPAAVACHLEDLFDDVAADQQHAINRKRQHLVATVDPSAAVVITDPQQLHDAVSNLVENAIAYSPDGSLIELGATASDGNACITIRDDGPGIPAADLTRIFERFYRVDKARSRESGGTGLGLSIVKHIVTRLGGTVAAANNPNGGAVFTIRVPLGAAAHGTATPVPHAMNKEEPALSEPAHASNELSLLSRGADSGARADPF